MAGNSWRRRFDGVLPRLSISRLSGRTGDREEAAGASQPEALPVWLWVIWRLTTAAGSFARGKEEDGEASCSTRNPIPAGGLTRFSVPEEQHLLSGWVGLSGVRSRFSSLFEVARSKRPREMVSVASD